MIRIFAAGAVLLSLAGAALAGETPADQLACTAMADQLAEAAENKAMDDSQKAEFGGLILTLLSQCENNELAAAGQTADKIRATVGG